MCLEPSLLQKPTLQGKGLPEPYPRWGKDILPTPAPLAFLSPLSGEKQSTEVKTKEIDGERFRHEIEEGAEGLAIPPGKHL